MLGGMAAGDSVLTIGKLADAAGVGVETLRLGVELIAGALSHAGKDEDPPTIRPSTPPRTRWRSTTAALPGIGIALMLEAVCPLCWPAYAGVLSAAGLNFLMEDRWLLPISAVFRAAALAWGAHPRRGYGPLSLRVLSAAAVVAGKS